MSDSDNSRGSRLALLLLAVAAGGTAVNRDVIAQRTQFTTVQAANTLANAVSRGFMEPTDQVHGGQKCWRLTAKGQERLAEARRQGVRLQDEAQARDPKVLADHALSLIAKAMSGLDTQQLATTLGASLAEIDAALAPHVEQHRLVTCGLLRGTQTLTQYRRSAGSTQGEDWRTHGSLGFHSGMTAQQVQAEQEARPAPKAPRQAAPKPPEVASEVVDAAPAAPPPPAPLPYLGELDIDAADRRAAANEGRPMPGEFICALYSNGALLVDSFGTRMTLPAEHTRKLLHYLDHLDARDLLGAHS